MQNNTATILKQLNYEAIEAHLITYFIISFDERKDLTSKTSWEIKLFVIEKVVKGNEETFNNFLKALEECEDVSNRQLMLKIQQDHKKEELAPTEPLHLPEALNTPYGSMGDELVLGEMSFQPQLSLQGSNSKTAS